MDLNGGIMDVNGGLTEDLKMFLNRAIAEARTSLNSKLEKQPKERSKFTIYRVHRHLRNVNSSAYEPEVISIGPYHHGKDHLKMMEDHKRHTLQLLVERKGIDIMECAKAIVGLESEAKMCYADKNFDHLNENEFVIMLVLDGFFIIELVRKFLLPDKEDDPIFQMGWMVHSLQRDLMLFENQVPFFVLLKLFDLIKEPHKRKLVHFLYYGRDCKDGLVWLLSNFFSNLYPGSGCRQPSEVVALQDSQEMMHLLDLIHRSWLPPKSQESEIKDFEFISCATRLTEANVKFEMKEAATLFDIGFKDGTMVMPPLCIHDGTECFLRNLMAYEQYFNKSQHNFVTGYILLLDFLINTSKDVEILLRNGIITNCKGDDEVVAKMVNKLCDSITCSKYDTAYANIYNDVNKHCKKRKNRWMAKLRRDYLHSPWAIISILAAVVLLLLTVIQTVFTILQVVQ